MTPERWARIKSVFGEAQKRSGEARQALLDERCGADAELRREVESLLLGREDVTELQSPVSQEDWIGKTISRYRILRKLGSGGMGVVYQAEDTTLHRNVALKLLPAGAIGDPAARSRFQKEAEAAATLDHPNITTIYEVGEDAGQSFIAMAFVDGKTLAEKIAERPLPLPEALDIASQVAAALEAAHERGVVHRDIKPGNIMLTPKGGVKVTDFGLARMAGQARLTKTGMILGTPAYMSPEQARGEEADHRSDIWSLGVVIYEMAAGQPPFGAETSQLLALTIQNEEPEPLTAVRSGVPMELDWVVGKALAKAPEERYQDAADLKVDLRTATQRLKSGASKVVKRAVVSRNREWIAWALLAACLAILFLSWGYRRTEQAAERPVRKWDFTAEGLRVGYHRFISPNGRHIAYVSNKERGEYALWIRDLDSLDSRRLAGTEGVGQGFFWSPDSKFIGFAVGTELLKKIAVDGGPPITICKLSGGYHGGSWSPDGETIVFSMRLQVHEVPASGGEPRVLFDRLDTGKGSANRQPILLPSRAGERNIVFSSGGGGGPADIVVMNLDSGDWRVLTEGRRPHYSRSGHIVFARSDAGRLDLWALPFDLESLEATGEPILIAENASVPSVSEDGTLVFSRVDDRPLQQLVWHDRDGNRLGTIGQPQPSMSSPALSPDGKTVAVAAAEGNLDIWLHDVDRPAKRRLTSHQSLDWQPIWSPSGNEIVHLSKRGGGFGIYQRSLDAGAESELLFEKPTAVNPYGWSRDGERLLFTARAIPHYDLWYLDRKAGGEGFEPVALLETPFDENAPALSPDGKFLAYSSDQSGEIEVWVSEFPSGGAQWQVSTNGGRHPRWSHAGKELFYVEEDTLMVSRVTTSPNFSVSSTKPLFSNPCLVNRPEYSRYDVSSDGRFVLIEDVATDSVEPPSINVVENWYEEFRVRDEK